MEGADTSETLIPLIIQGIHEDLKNAHASALQQILEENLEQQSASKTYINMLTDSFKVAIENKNRHKTSKEISRSFLHCFSERFSLTEMQSYMMSQHFWKADLTEQYFNSYISSTTEYGREYLRHAAVASRQRAAEAKKNLKEKDKGKKKPKEKTGVNSALLQGVNNAPDAAILQILEKMEGADSYEVPLISLLKYSVTPASVATLTTAGLTSCNHILIKNREFLHSIECLAEADRDQIWSAAETIMEGCKSVAQNLTQSLIAKFREQAASKENDNATRGLSRIWIDCFSNFFNLTEIQSCLANEYCVPADTSAALLNCFISSETTAARAYFFCADVAYRKRKEEARVSAERKKEKKREKNKKRNRAKQAPDQDSESAQVFEKPQTNEPTFELRHT